MAGGEGFGDLFRFISTYGILVVLFMLAGGLVFRKLIVRWLEKGEIEKLIRLVENLLGQNRIQEAIPLLARLETEYAGRISPQEMGRIEFAQGLSCLSLASREKEGIYLKRAIQFFSNILRNPMPTVERNRVCLHLAQGYQRLAQLEDGDENLEKAEQAYREAARTWPVEDSVGVLQCQNHLAKTLLSLAELRDRDKLLIEGAIRAAQNALQVKGIENLPQSFVQARNTLGEGLLHLAALEEGEANLQKAEALFDQTLSQDYLRQYPLLQAQTYRGLGRARLALATREEGDPLLLDQAISHLQEGLQLLNPEGNPSEYGAVQRELGTAYLAKARLVDAEENLQKAVRVLTEALKITTLDHDPEGYRLTQESLGQVYQEWSRQGDSLEYSWRAVLAFREALKGAKAGNSPKKLAEIYNRLGFSYLEFSHYGEEAKYLRYALEAFSEGVPHLQSGIETEELAQTHLNRGIVYLDLARIEDPDRNIQGAIEAFAESLRATVDYPNLKKANNLQESVEKASTAFVQTLRERRVDENPLFLRKYHVYLEQANDAFRKVLQPLPKPNQGSGKENRTRREDLVRALQTKSKGKSMEEAVAAFEWAMRNRR